MAADMAIKFLLLIDALQQTNRETPKTSKDLILEVESAWNDIFPDTPTKPLSESTIGRHIRDMNRSGLYHIETCKNAKEGYYRASFPFDAAEFSIMALALHRCTTLSKEDTQAILQKFLHQTDDLGENYLNIVAEQARRTNLRRKTERKMLPIIRKLLLAIWRQQKIRFAYFEWDEHDRSKMKRERDESDGHLKRYTASPYYLVWNADTLYLIAHAPDTDTVSAKGKTIHHLSHFKVNLIDDDLQILDEKNLPVTNMKEFFRYFMARTITEEQLAYKRKEGVPMTREDKQREIRLVKFSLDRYIREHPGMIQDNSPMIDLRLKFREEFIGTILAELNLNRGAIRAYPLPETEESGERMYSALVTIQESEGLYRWLMQYAGHVTVVEPGIVRRKMRKRLQDAMRDIREYEKGEREPITEEEIRERDAKKKGRDMLEDMEIKWPGMD